MSVTIHDVKQGTDEWLDLRKNKVTGTKAATLLTHGKQAAIDKDKNSTFTGNQYTDRGHRLEPDAIAVYNHVYNVDILEVGFVTNSLYSDCGYSPDGILNKKLIEVKCFNESRHIACSKEIPFTILSQIHFGMMVCELEECDLIFYNPDIGVEKAFIVCNIKYETRIVNNFIDKLSNHAAK
jgi:hypothetical protein